MNYIEIYNDFGTVLVDDNALNHRLIKNGNVPVQQGSSLWGVANVTVQLRPNYSTQPLVAFSTTSTTNGIYMSLNTIYETSRANEFMWTYYVGRQAITGSCDYFVFQDGLDEPMAGTGLVVCRNADNVVVFDSDAKYARMVDVVTVPLDTVNMVKNYPAGRRYAVTNTTPLVRRVSGGGGGGAWLNVYPIGAAINGSTITFGHYFARGNNGTATGATVGNAVAATFIVFDVTGL